MLHCPRYSEPLEVQDAPEAKTCPAGRFCPHQSSSAPSSSSLSNQINYLSGGGIILPGSQHQESQAAAAPSGGKQLSSTCCCCHQQLVPALRQSFQCPQQQLLTLVPGQLILTTTVHQPVPLVSTTTRTVCQPQTPAIVVASSPFFHQQRSPPRPYSLHEVLRRNLSQLEQSCWYYPGLDWIQSSKLLANTAAGTFLVRESQDRNFLFSLSVQRSEGPTSVRIHFKDGRFILDAEDSILNLMPDFESVVELIGHYLYKDDQRLPKTPLQAWVDGAGQRSSPIRLRRPLLSRVPTLAHLSRVSLTRQLLDSGAIHRISELKLPDKLEEYLRQYPNMV